jgi:CBS domain-containing protein
MDNNSLAEVQSKRRFWLSIIIVAMSIIILAGVAWLLFFYGEDNESGELVFTAIIGLVGAWIGTILAFYFSKDNFEAASKATQDLVVKLTGEQRLKSITVEEAMMKLESMNYFILKETEDKIKIKDLLVKFSQFNRLPVFSEKLRLIYIIHKSVVNQFISECAMGKHPDIKKELEKLTLQDLNSIETNLTQIKEGFVTVSPEDNLAIAKKKMESNKKALCSDVFVTENGTTDSKVIGWITNLIINEKSSV